MISGTSVILHYCTVALLSNRLSSVARLALGSELSQNFAVSDIFLSSPIHKEPQPLESDIQMAGLFPPLHLSVNCDHTSLCPLDAAACTGVCPDNSCHPSRLHSALGAVQGPLQSPRKFPNGLNFNFGGVGTTNPTTKNKQGVFVPSCSSFLLPPCTGTPNSTVSMVRDGSQQQPCLTAEEYGRGTTAQRHMHQLPKPKEKGDNQTMKTPQTPES